MLSYDEAKTLLIRGLLQAADRHEVGAYEKLGDGFEEIDSGLPRDRRPEFSKLYTALNFWDSWVDASNHQWKYYPGIEAKDWPVLARRIVADLQVDREITDPLVFKWFAPQKQSFSSLTHKLGKLIKK